ncbi:MAG: hypothetical protein ACI8W3_000887 [Myxococcota bacterium]
MTVGGINGLLAYHAYGRGSQVGAASAGRSHRAAEPQHKVHDVASADEKNLTKPDPSDESSEGSATELSKAEERELERLKARDREVRAHEQAHKAAAGRHANGGPNYSFTRGPDGRPYATEGSVSVDTSEVSGDPGKTLAKMQQVQRAALAPADPSPQDARVASVAAQKATEARAEIAQTQQLDTNEDAQGHEQGGDHSAIDTHQPSVGADRTTEAARPLLARLYDQLASEDHLNTRFGRNTHDISGDTAHNSPRVDVRV